MVEFTVALVAVLAFILSLYNFLHLRSTRRKKLINAVYHHVTLAEEHLENIGRKTEEVAQKIKTDESYLPYIPRSASDDLTYDHVIELMQWLNSREQEETVLRYFHLQSNLHALAAGFELEFIRGWRLDRKLSMWKLFEEYRKSTLERAQEAKEILEPMKG